MKRGSEGSMKALSRSLLQTLARAGSSSALPSLVSSAQELPKTYPRGEKPSKCFFKRLAAAPVAAAGWTLQALRCRARGLPRPWSHSPRCCHEHHRCHCATLHHPCHLSVQEEGEEGGVD